MVGGNPGKSTQPDKPPARFDYLLLTVISSIFSCATLVFYFRAGAILLYGDAVAHINIARHLFDSRTPGFLELGTVWLPVPHLLVAPFIVNDWLWQSGVGGALPSMIAYVFGTLGVFRLVRGLASRTAAWIAALLYALNPNLLYMQSSAMTESIYLALFIWGVVYFSEFVSAARTDARSSGRSLARCAMALSAAMLVRYDAWFLATCAFVGVLITVWRLKLSGRAVWGSVMRFALLLGLTGCLWLGYNRGAYGNPFEFLNGPYSARAIAKRTTMTDYPGAGDPRVAAVFFLKTAELNTGEPPAHLTLLNLAFVALLVAIYFSRRHLPCLLLWTPVVFYVLSIAWGSVPIFLPNWWPHSYYNVRYGLQLLPAIVVFAGLACDYLAVLVSVRWSSVLVVLLAVLSYVGVWRDKPICLREAVVNGSARLQFDAQLAAELKKLPPSATLMMYGGMHPGAIQAAGIHFDRVVREGNHPEWEFGLVAPAKAADYVIAVEGDDVADAVRHFPQGLHLIAIVDTPGKSKAFIYRSMR